MNSQLRRSVLLGLAAVSIIAGCESHKSPTEPTPPCTFSLSSAAATVGSGGGEGTVTVTTQASCAWVATSNTGWITITAGASGNGPGPVTYSVAPNTAANSRSTGITIAGQSFTITQDARPPVVCTYDLSPVSADFSKDGSAGAFTVTTAAECPWTASSSTSWVVVDGAGRGSGTASISYTVARNNDTSARNATIDVAGRQFTVRQSGDAGACQYSVAPVSFSPCMANGTLAVSVTTQTSCPWTAAPAASWLTVTSGASGAGTGSISIAYTDNYDAPRESVVMVRWPTPTAGQNVHVAQAGCRYGVSRKAIDVDAAGGNASFDVLQQSDPTTCGGATQDRCVWTAVSNAPWITITSSMPRSGDNPVSFAVAPNTSTSSRTGTIVVRDQVVTITQKGI
jgi:hypothetical protein